ncbi:gluconokinase [Williamsia sterculiae]|uniref:Gluconokinase n=1 Tax=Williamsia sterculiae TaxID=1344003 RepID=A0A1N7H1K8_9NOCA|nr:gluconokinase [Williamsia sterculiae]SIS18711.1 gluconate kinase, SKI family [Williamsia sterculiae]
MGVSGSGKSVVGAALAQRLRVPFADADDLHPQANIDKMAAGVPLDDADRTPWLETIAGWLREHRTTGGVVACSALKRSYRDVLRSGVDADTGVQFLYLSGSRELIAARQASRPGHFMPAALLDSQFDTLEPLGDAEAGVTVDVSLPINDIVDRYVGVGDEGAEVTA